MGSSAAVRSLSLSLSLSLSFFSLGGRSDFGRFTQDLQERGVCVLGFGFMM